MKKIAVIGSMNVDHVVRVPYFPLPGETLKGSSFSLFAGGKGGNQAVAAARLTEGVMMLGCLGQDGNGQFYQDVLTDNRVLCEGIKRTDVSPTGITLIEVDEKSGDNRIVYVSGANDLVDRAQIDASFEKLLAYDLFLMQLELPLDTVCYAARLLSEAGKTVILDPAPAIPLPDDLYEHIAFITPNETELAILTGLPTQTADDMVTAARTLIAKGAKAVIAKAGKRGAYYVGSDALLHAPGFTVKAIDTTAAGDSFNAGFAAGISQNLSVADALRYANATAALSTTAAGAQGGMPSRAQVATFLKDRPQEALVTRL